MKKRVLATLLVAGVLSSSVFAKTVAVVNNNAISSEELNLMARQMSNGQKSFDSLPKEIQNKILEGVIGKKLLANYALKSGVTKSKDYKQALKLAKEEIALQVWQKQEYDKIKVSQTEAKEFYKENSYMLNQPKRVHARHILVKTKKEAQKIIDELKRAKDLKEAFIKAAKKYSTGPSSSKGGDLGYFTKNQMVKEFSQAAFSLKKNQMTLTPIHTNFGWHIIYVEDIKEGGQTPFEEVKEQMYEGAKMKKFKEFVESKIKKLKKSAKIEYK